MVAADAAETGGRIAGGAARDPATRAAPARQGNARIETRRGPRRGKKTEEGRSTRIETRRRTKHEEDRKPKKEEARRGKKTEEGRKPKREETGRGTKQEEGRRKSKREKRRHPKREEAQGAGPRGAGCRMEGGFPRLINEDQSLREVNARETCVYFRMGRRRFSLVGGGATAVDLV